MFPLQTLTNKTPVCKYNLHKYSLDDTTLGTLDYNNVLFESDFQVLSYLFSLQNSQILSLQLSNASYDLSSRISNKLLNTQVSLSYTNNCCYLFCYLFLKLREIIKENVSITLFRVTTE